MFNHWLRKMRESGVMLRLVKQWYSDSDSVRNMCAKDRETGGGDDEEDGGGFGLNRVGVFFLVVAVGTLASVITLAVERIRFACTTP